MVRIYLITFICTVYVANEYLITVAICNGEYMSNSGHCIGDESSI